MAYRKGQENLIPVTKRSKEEHLEMSRRGGVKSGESKRAKKAASDLAKVVLDLTPKMPNVIEQQMVEMGIKSKKPEARLIAMCAMMRKAMAGDIKSYEFLLNLAGEMPESGGGVPVEDVDEDQQFDQQRIRETLDSMSDDQLRSYQELCNLFSGQAKEEESE